MSFVIRGTALRRIAAAVALACLCTQAFAQMPARPYTERAYDPPVGSRWAVVSRTDTEENRAPDPNSTRRLETRNEFSIDEKLADGFRISFVMREIKMTGTAPTNAIAEKAFGAIKDIVIRGRTNAAGKPLAVENIDEVKSNVSVVVANLVRAFDKNPKVAELLRQMLEGFMIVDGPQAAETYMEDMLVLAAGQSTGIMPGAVKRQDEAVPSPLGAGSIKSTLETRIESFDAATGNARYIRKRVFDPAAMKVVVVSLAEKMIAAAGSQTIPPDVLSQIRDVSLEIESEMVITVEGGMTRMIDDRSVTTARLMGRIMRKIEKKTMSVTRMN